MDAASPWAIKMQLNYADGFARTPCVSCTNLVQTITLTTWQAKLEGCSTRLSVNSAVPGTQDWGLDVNAQPTNIGSGWTSYFTNTEPTRCPLTECRLRNTATDTTCATTTYTGPELTMDSTSPY